MFFESVVVLVVAVAGVSAVDDVSPEGAVVAVVVEDAEEPGVGFGVRGRARPGLRIRDRGRVGLGIRGRGRAGQGGSGRGG